MTGDPFMQPHCFPFSVGATSPSAGHQVGGPGRAQRLVTGSAAIASVVDRRRPRGRLAAIAVAAELAGMLVELDTSHQVGGYRQGDRARRLATRLLIAA